MSIGSNIDRVLRMKQREDKKWTQGYLALQVGCRREKVNRIIHDLDVDTKIITKIYEVLGIKK